MQVGILNISRTSLQRDAPFTDEYLSAGSECLHPWIKVSSTGACRSPAINCPGKVTGSLSFRVTKELIVFPLIVII